MSTHVPPVRASVIMEMLEQRVLLSGIPVTDYSDVALPTAPTLPAKLGTFTDPEFGTKIIRVTDSTDGNNNHVAYSYWPSFNKDSTYLHLMQSGTPKLYSFNPATASVSLVGDLFVGNVPSPGAGKPRWEDSVWSGTDAKVIFGHEGPRIWAYNVETHVYTLVKDFTGTTGWNSGDKIWQMHRSLDDNTFSFTRTNSSDAKIGWAVWKRDTDTLPLFVNTTLLDEAQIDKSGEYLIEKTGLSTPASAIKVKVWDVAAGTYEELTSGTPDRAPGHSDVGFGKIVGFENWNNTTNARDLSSPHDYTTIWAPEPANQGGALWQAGHLSMLADGDEWAVQSRGYSATDGKTGPFLNEIFLSATDGSGRVIRLAHHRSDFTPYNYWDWPMGNISRDGRFIAFTSDWEGTGQRDVFILRVPIPGDANMDYVVNATDYNIWDANEGQTNANWGQGDWNADHVVDNEDYLLWLANSGGGGTPIVSIAATDPTASEDLPNNGVFTVTRTGATTAALTVNFTKSGTATNGSDYNSIGTTVTIPIGSSSTTITLTPINDSSIESSETAVFTLAAGTGYAVGSPAAATVTLLDNDTVIGPAHDEFDYTTFSGGSGGSGWSDDWAVTSTTNTGTYTGSLSYSSGGTALATGGNRVWTWKSAEATRNVSTSYGVDGTSRWIGFLMNTSMDGGSGTFNSEVDLGSQLRIATVYNGKYILRSNIGGNEVFASSNVNVQAGTTRFIVARIDYGATDVVRMWIDPVPGTQPSDGSADATLTLPAGQSFSTGTLIKLRAQAYYSRAQYDELRYGTTYASVAPLAGGSVPAAPSDLVATPTTNSMILNWTDHANNESGFRVWRSTDNLSWGSVYASVGSNVTTYTDPSPSAGVGYYYKVASYNGSGESTTTAGMTSAFATVLGSDDFDYSTLSGASGGYGWSNNWAVTSTTNTGIYTGSLEYADGPNALFTSGDRIWLWKSAEANRNLSTSYGTDGTSRWIGFMMRSAMDGGSGTLTGEVDLGTELRIGAPYSGKYTIRTNIGGAETFASTGINVVSGTTAFIVARIDYGATDVVRMWVNPTPGTQPTDGSADATLTLPGGQSFSTGTQIRVRSGAYYNRAQFDEIRYGLSYLAVAPDPIIEVAKEPDAMHRHRGRRGHHPATALPPHRRPAFSTIFNVSRFIQDDGEHDARDKDRIKDLIATA